MRHIKRNQTIIPPEGGWIEHAWYIVDVAYCSANPIHRSLFYTGFLNGGKPNEKRPGNYSALVGLSTPEPDDEPMARLEHVTYCKAIHLLITVDDAKRISTPSTQPANVSKNSGEIDR